MILDERSPPLWRPTNSTNATSATLPARVPRITALPTLGNGLIKTGDDGAYTARTISLLPFGVGSATNTFTMAVLGWRPTPGVLPDYARLWVPSLLAKFTVTMGTTPGISGADVGASQLFATTITATLWPTGDPSLVPPVAEEWYVISPGGNDLALVRVGILGFPYVEITFATGSSATSCNALYALL